METSISKTTSWNNEAIIRPMHTTRQNRLETFFKKQAKYETAWFLASLTFQGVFFLPIPVALTYYFGAPGYLLVITMGLFFANIIAGMASAGIRTIVYILGASIVIHLLLLAFYII